ncbi:hypothetical protein [Micromonospora sp. WMMD812]|uniref:hypothetical protein n=1 Tax=Micromonospora sp. WMMD812 TaxID=3015152 RepID=UPI00248B2B25|nr:hypothetical protein [Micromonospora sp. WMMD812]WBB65114.1 hypothetical protein O7603_18000 [Micromonospora sp. WMMD812]
MTAADVDLTAAPGSSGRALARTQFILTAVYVAAIGVALGRAAAFSGHLYLPQQGDEYTANAYLWPGLWRPASLVMIVVIGTAPLFTAATAFVATVRLTKARSRAAGHPRSLIVGTILTTLVAVSALTPPVQELLGWLLD